MKHKAKRKWESARLRSWQNFFNLRVRVARGTQGNVKCGMNQEVALLLKFLLLSFRFQTLVFDFCQKIFTVYPILDLGLAAFPFILSNIGKANPPLHHFIFCNENIYWYEAQVLSLEPWAPRIGRRPNCERRSPLQNPYPKSILFLLFIQNEPLTLACAWTSWTCGRLLGGASKAKAALAAFAKSEGWGVPTGLQHMMRVIAHAFLFIEID